MPLPLPCREEPRPELACATQVTQETRPQIADLAGPHEQEHIVGFRLPHQLAHEVGPDLRIGILESPCETGSGSSRSPRGSKGDPLGPSADLPECGSARSEGIRHRPEPVTRSPASPFLCRVHLVAGHGPPRPASLVGDRPQVLEVVPHGLTLEASMGVHSEPDAASLLEAEPLAEPFGSVICPFDVTLDLSADRWDMSTSPLHPI